MDTIRKKLAGELIGLARATDGSEHLISPESTGVILDGLRAFYTGVDDGEAETLLKRVEDAKRKMVPGCFACACPCGRTSAYDLFELDKADPEIRELKNRILTGIGMLAASGGEFCGPDIFYKALIVVGMDDYTAEDLAPIAREIRQKQNASDAARAREILESGGYTCVLCLGDAVYTTVLRGVRPLMQWLEFGEDLKGFSAADKVVGKATAYLYCLLGVRSVYAQVMSEAALDVLRRAGLEVSYGQLVDHIINRKGDGICPFESAVMEIDQPEAARIAIRRKMAEMNISL